MQADVQHALDRTIAVYDQLGALWGPEGRLSLSIHGLPHDQIHRLGGPDEAAYRSPIAWRADYLVSTIRITPLGWRIGFVGKADLTCRRCRALLGIPDGVEAAQAAGVTEAE